MTVKMAKKEADSQGKPEEQLPSNNVSAPAQQQVQDHTHPEYDKLLVKMQEIETELQNKKAGGVQQETIEEKVEKPEGAEEVKEQEDKKKAEKVEDEPKTPEAEDEKVIKEKPAKTESVESDETNEAEVEVKEEASLTNEDKLKLAKDYLEKSKKLIAETEEDAPAKKVVLEEKSEEPESEKKPEEAEPENKKEEVETEDKEKKVETKEDEDKADSVIEDEFKKIKEELKKEYSSNRKSLVGISSPAGKIESYVDIKTASKNEIKKYLSM